MITAIVRWRLAEPVSREQLIERFQHSLPVYRNRPGLVRKYLCFDAASGRGMGIYLWEDRARAEAFYEIAVPIIRSETGSDPEIEYIDTPMVVDNLTGDVSVH
jgi:hypothetical protein